MEADTVTEIAIFDQQPVPALFTDRERADAMLARIKEAVKAEPVDLSTKKGRDAVRSLARKVARSKTAIDKAAKDLTAKDLTAQQRAQIDAVNAERRRMVDELQTLQDETRAPLTKWKEAEEARVENLKQRLAGIDHPDLNDTSGLKDVQAAIADLSLLSTNEATWQEFASQAEDRAKVELERLKGVAGRIEERIEREAREAREKAAEAARLAAEHEKIEAEKAELARQRAELEVLQKAEADRKAAEEAKRREEQEAREAAERAKAQAEETERLAKEAAEQAERDRQAAIEKAAQDERDRIAREEREAKEAEAKRMADEEHIRRIRQDIIDDTDMMTGEEIADALMAGKVRHCLVAF